MMLEHTLTRGLQNLADEGPQSHSLPQIENNNHCYVLITLPGRSSKPPWPPGTTLKQSHTARKPPKIDRPPWLEPSEPPIWAIFAQLFEKDMNFRLKFVQFFFQIKGRN